ncbi:hypothetical protein ADP8_05096 (plasmid) [Roseomonas mucosa]|nr:hypothetical protein ADP8_05096 [Roseomonas mucosa]
MVDNAATALWIGRAPDALNRFADGNELLIARQLLDAPSVDSLEHHEVADEIEQIGRGEKPGEQDVLSGWGIGKLFSEGASSAA